MMRVGVALLRFCLWLVPGITLAETTSFQLDSTLVLGHDRDQVTTSELVLEPDLEFAWGEGLRGRMSARLRHDFSNRLVPGKPDRTSYAAASGPFAYGPEGSLELRDFYVDFDTQGVRWRIGKQQIVWGELDGIKVLDTVNPQNFREFILDDFSDSRIGLWTINAEFGARLGKREWDVQTFWALDSSTHELPREGATFVLTAPRFRFGAVGPSALPTRSSHSDNMLRGSAFGVRLRRSTAGGVDIAASVMSGLDPEPLGRLVLDPMPTLERFFRRRTVAGLSTAFSFGPAAMRAELAFQPKRHFATQVEEGALASSQAWQSTLGLGVDLQTSSQWLLSAQFLHDRVINPPRGLIRPDADSLVTITARRSFGYDRWRTEFRWYGSLSDGDGIWRMTTSYALNDNSTLALSADLFYGDGIGLFGQFADRDRLVMRYEFTY